MTIHDVEDRGNADVHTRLSWTFALLAASTAAVLLLSFFTLRRAARDLFVECRGDLVTEITSRDAAGASLAPPGDFRVAYDAKKGGYENVRVVATREGAPPACNDVEVPWLHDDSRIWRIDVRQLAPDRFAVTVPAHETGGRRPPPETLVVFRRVDHPGRRFVPANVLSPGQLPSVITLVALGALALGLGRARRAAAYSTRMHRWTEARLRPDGLLESEGGSALGTVDRGARVPAGPVIVDQDALEGHDVYRGLPVIVRGRIAAGSHERWLEGTMRRLRDARTLAILATLVASAGLLARLVG